MLGGSDLQHEQTKSLAQAVCANASCLFVFFCVSGVRVIMSRCGLHAFAGP